MLSLICKFISLSFLSNFKLDFEFFDTNSSIISIPFELGIRNQNNMWISTVGLIISVTFLAFSRFGSSNYIYVFYKLLSKNNSINKIIQDEFSLSSIGSVLLILNYIVSFSSLIYLTFYNQIDFFSARVLLLFFIPMYLLLWPLFWFWSFGFLVDNHEVFSENKKNIIVISQFKGIIFTLMLLFWTFNQKWSSCFIYCFMLVLFFAWVYKLLRGIIFSIQHNISWYYIILYFCTLELIPFFFIYTYFFEVLF